MELIRILQSTVARIIDRYSHPGKRLCELQITKKAIQRKDQIPIRNIATILIQS